MTITIEDIAAPAIPGRWTLTGVNKVTSSIDIRGMLLDRNWIHGNERVSNRNILKMSQDDGTTWASIHTFDASATGTEWVAGLVEWSDGEVCVATSAGNGLSAYIYRSSGWGSTLAQKQAATWAMVYQTPGGFFTDVWGFRQPCVGTGTDSANGFFSVYGGGQTVAGGDAVNVAKARYCFRTKNRGQTWTVAYDIYNQPQTPQQESVHIHATCRDSAWLRDWFVFGDEARGQGTAGLDGNNRQNQMVGYMDDDGAPQYLPTPDELVNVICQYTGLLATDKALILGVDAHAPNMIVMYPKTGYRTFGPPVLDICNHVNTPYIKNLQAAGPGFPILRGDAPANQAAINNGAQEPAVYVSHDGGFGFYPVWKDPAPVNGLSGFYGAIVGPTLRGKLLAVYEAGYIIGNFAAP